MEDLIMDSLFSFHHGLKDARDRIDPSNISSQVMHTLLGYREWAIANPIAFGLFAGRQVYGFDPLNQSISSTAEKGYQILFNLFDRAWQKSLIAIPQSLVLPLPYKRQMLKISQAYGLSSPEELIHLVIQILALVHGLISMELSARFDLVVEDGSGLFRFQVITALAQMGLSYQEDQEDQEE